MSKRWFATASIFLLVGTAPSFADKGRFVQVNGAGSASSLRMVSAVQANDPALRLGYRLGGRVDQELPTDNQRQLRIFVDQEAQRVTKQSGVFLSPDVGSLREPEFTMSVGITW